MLQTIVRKNFMHFADNLERNLKKSSSLPKATEIEGSKFCPQTTPFDLRLKTGGIKRHQRLWEENREM